MRYHTVVPIGSGGMGEVYKAWDADLERHVALKVLRHLNPDMEERLIREARIQAQIEHPGVCQVYEVGELNGRPCIAMEYVEGSLLDEAADELGLEQKVLVMQKVAEAVQAAHAAGLMHRDLKPANIIVADADGQLRPYVLDFGLARQQKVTGLTVTGQILGTPGYLSPEQARGEINSLDRRTDVFSLGVILYELLCGELPFAGSSPIEILQSLLREEPRSIRKLAPRVPAELECIILKCLEKSPERRFGSAQELADDLGRFLAGEPVEAQPVGRLRQLTRMAKRNRAWVASIVIALVAVTTTVSVVIRSQWSARQAALASQRFGQEVERIEGVLRRAHLSPLHDLTPEIQDVQSRMQWIELEMERLGKPARATGHSALGRGFLELGETHKALLHLRESKRLGADDDQLLYSLGVTLSRLYRAELEKIAAIRSSELREKLRIKADTELRRPAFEYLTRVRGNSLHSDYVAASLEYLNGHSRAALEKLVSSSEEESWFYEADLLAGDIHADHYRAEVTNGQTVAASTAFESALDSYSRATEIGRSDPRGYEGLCLIWSEALKHRFHGDQAELETVRERALDACGKALRTNPKLPKPHLRMARIESYWADYASGLGIDPTPTLATARAHLNTAREHDPDSPEVLVALGVTFRIEGTWTAQQGRDSTQLLERALESYQRATEVAPDHTSAHLSRTLVELHLGDYLRRRGADPRPHFENAIAAGRHTIELEPGLVGGHVNLGIAYEQMAILCRDQSSWTDAETYFGLGTAELRAAVDLNPDFYTSHFNLGELLVEHADLVLSRGEDPTPLIAESAIYLGQTIAAWPDWAPPHFLLLRGQTLLAFWAMFSNGDPTESLEQAARLETAAFAVGSDAVSLLIAARAKLAAARWKLEKAENPEVFLSEARLLALRSSHQNPGVAELHWVRGDSYWIESLWALSSGQDARSAIRAGMAEARLAQGANSRDRKSNLLLGRLSASRAKSLSNRGKDPNSAIQEGLEAVESLLDLNPSSFRAIRTHRELIALRERTEAPVESSPARPKRSG